MPTALDAELTGAGRFSARLSRRLSPAQQTLGLLLVVVAVRGVLGYGAGRTEASARFATGVAFESWALLLAATVAVWVAIAVFLWRTIDEVFGASEPRSVGPPLAAYGIIASIVLGSLFVRSGGPTNPLYASGVKVPIIVTTVFLLGSPAVLGLWWTQARVSRLQHELPLAPPVAPHGAPPPDGDTVADDNLPETASIPDADQRVAGRSRAGWVADLLGLRRLTQRILIAVSIGISAAVLSTGALRTALLQSGALTPEDFPSHWVLLYGAFFTVVFTVVFVPSFLEWRGVASRLVDDAFPIPHDGRPDAAWHEGRRHMAQMLGLDASPLEALGPLLGILSPVLISLAAVFVPELAPA